MDIQFHGANCLTFTGKRARIVVDDNLNELGAKTVAKEGDITLQTFQMPAPQTQSKLIVDQPGEYEVSEVSIYGIAARAHMDEERQRTTTMYKLVLDDTSILVTGHIYPELSDAQLEAIGTVDIMIVPV